MILIICKNFNTTSVLIKLGMVAKAGRAAKISIQLLFLLNGSLSLRVSGNSINFNTTSVLIKWRYRKRLSRRYYISIQLLFLLNTISCSPGFIYNYFNTTSVLIKSYSAMCSFALWTNFNTTSVLIKWNKNLGINDFILFQYNFCSY